MNQDESLSSNAELDCSKESRIIPTELMSIPYMDIPYLGSFPATGLKQQLAYFTGLSLLQNYHQNQQVPVQIITISAFLSLSLSYPLHQKV